MKKRILLKSKLFVLIMCCLSLSMATTVLRAQTVSGTVRSLPDNLPLPGVVVKVSGDKNKGTSTDANGKYKLSGVPAKASITFSMIGYKTETFEVNGKSVIDAGLVATSSDLDEVVVVGYGTQKKANLTGSVSTITAKDLTAVPTANVATLLYGKLPGLVAVQREGAPGSDDVDLSIRGLPDPLVVVDGIQGRDFTRLDPNEIESITILKDAAAAAVYGVSGGNGVILVTTKKGIVGKPVFSYNGNFGVQHITTFPKQVDAEGYAILKNQSVMNTGGTTPFYTQEEVAKFKAGTEPGYPNFDNFSYWYRDNAPQASNSISVRGGSDKIKYFFLLGQSSQGSIFRDVNQEFRKYNFRSSVSANITKNLQIGVDLSGRNENRDNTVQSTYLMAAWYYYQAPIYTPKNPDGTIANTNYGLAAYLDKDLSGYSKNARNAFQGSLSIKYAMPFVKGLSADLLASRDLNFSDNKLWQKNFGLYGYNTTLNTSTKTASRGVNSLQLATAKSSYAYIRPSLNYQRSFSKKHNVKAMLIYEVSETEATNFSASRVNYVASIDELFAGPDLNKDNEGGASNNGRESYIGRLNYDYLGKYLFEYSFRYDGSAKFPRDRRWGYFQGISAGWRISDEKFLKGKIPALDDLKIRASFGQLGNDKTGDFQFLAGYVYPSTNYILGGDAVSSGLVESKIPNPNITWEQHQTYNLGLDASFWKGMFRAEVDVFYKKSNGILATRNTQLPITFGATLPAENLNSLDGTGGELSLTYNKKFNNFRLSLSPNVSYFRLRNRHYESRPFVTQYDNYKNNFNERLGSVFFGYKSIGQFTSMEQILNSPIQDGKANLTLLPGDVIYEDYNGDGKVDAYDTQPVAYGYASANSGFESRPLMNYGIGINLSYKKFNFNMNWQGAAMVYTRLAYNAIAPFKDGRSANAYLLDNWHRADPTDNNSEWIPGKFPATIVNGATNNLLNSDFWIRNATYLRLKSASISYALQGNFLKKVGVQNLTIILSGQNLLTISGLGEFELDPENKNGAGSYYPQMLTINGGIQLTF